MKLTGKELILAHGSTSGVISLDDILAYVIANGGGGGGSTDPLTAVRLVVTKPNEVITNKIHIGAVAVPITARITIPQFLINIPDKVTISAGSEDTEIALTADIEVDENVDFILTFTNGEGKTKEIQGNVARFEDGTYYWDLQGIYVPIEDFVVIGGSAVAGKGSYKLNYQIVPNEHQVESKVETVTDTTGKVSIDANGILTFGSINASDGVVNVVVNTTIDGISKLITLAIEYKEDFEDYLVQIANVAPVTTGL